MRTFIQKQNSTQKPNTAGSARSNRTLSGQSHEVSSILHLQRTIGNQAVQRLLHVNHEKCDASPVTSASPHFERDFSRIPLHAKTQTEIQPKLTISTPGDAFEQEADRMANQVVGTVASSGGLQRGCAECREEEVVQMRAATDIAAPTVDDRIQALRGGGQGISTSERAYFEPRFGYDFSNVRLHTDSRAADAASALNARAFTVGRDVIFGAAQYAPRTDKGKRLIAHELTHVLQQGAAPTIRPAPISLDREGRRIDNDQNMRQREEEVGKDSLQTNMPMHNSSRVTISTVSNPLIQPCWILQDREYVFSPQDSDCVDFRRRWPGRDTRGVELIVSGDDYIAMDLSTHEAIGRYPRAIQHIEPTTIIGTSPILLLRVEDTGGILDSHISDWYTAARFGIQNSPISGPDGTLRWFLLALGGNLVWAFAGMPALTTPLGIAIVAGAVIGSGTLAQFFRNNHQQDIGAFRSTVAAEWLDPVLRRFEALMSQLNTQLIDLCYDQGLTNRDDADQAEERRRVAWRFLFGTDDYSNGERSRRTIVESRFSQRVVTLWQAFQGCFRIFNIGEEGGFPSEEESSRIAVECFYRSLVTTGIYREIPGVVGPYREFSVSEAGEFITSGNEIIRFPGGAEAVIQPGRQIPR